MKQFISKVVAIYNDPHTTVDEDNKKTLSLLLYVTNVLGLIALVIVIIQYQAMHIPLSTLIYTILFLPFVIALIYKDNLGVRKTSLLATIAGYLISSYILLTQGYFGLSLPLYVTVVAITTFILGFKEALITLGIILLTIAVIGLLYVKNFIDISPQMLFSYKSWVTWAAVFFVMMFIGINLSFTLYRFHRKLIQSLNYSENKTHELKESNEELSRIKEKLEQLVRDRTTEIATKNSELLANNEELERFNNLFIGREFRIKELRDRVKQLEALLKKHGITEVHKK